MRVFVTGATGWVGSAVVPELIGAGHTVLGLARSDASAKALADIGVEAHRGELDDPNDLARAAASADGVIHLAFKHDFSAFAANVETDRVAVETIGAALANSGKPLVITSGTLMTAFAAPGVVGTEESAPPAGVPRVASEMAALALAERGVRSSIVRLPPSVHGEGDRGFMPGLIDLARTKGVSAYVGDGQNRWPAGHRFDAARLFRLALETGVAGSRYHAVGDPGIPVREIAEIIGRKLNVPTASLPPEEAPAHFGFLAMFIGLDAPSSSRLTQERLGWMPREKGLIEDLETGTYFEGGVSGYDASGHKT